MMNAVSRRAACGAALACTIALAAAGTASAQTPSLLDYAASLEPCASNLSEAQLDQVVAVYTYDGRACEVTAREVIEDASDLSSRRNADGTYAAPSAEDVLTYVRNQILKDLVTKAGVEVSDEEVAAYTAASFGTDDVAAVAGYYGLDTQKALRILTEGAALSKLRDQVVGTMPAAPEGPEQPADGDVTALVPAYAAYILDLAGGAWDEGAGGWVAGTAYAQAMAPYAFDGRSASYDMALAAYYAACSAYSEAVNAQYATWSAYTNEYLSQATLTMLTLKS